MRENSVVKRFYLPVLACVAGGIVSAREIKFWTSERRSREENGERDSEISESLSPFSSRLRRSFVQNFISRALTLPPATQAIPVLLVKYSFFLNSIPKIIS